MVSGAPIEAAIESEVESEAGPRTGDEAGPNLAPTIALTTGEPAGVGCEIALAAAGEFLRARPGMRVVLVGDRRLIEMRAQQIGAQQALTGWRADLPPAEPCLEVMDVPLAVAARAGQLDVRNAPYVLATLDAAIDGALAGRFAALVTAPVQKSIINAAGIAFSGHTEYLAARTGAPHVVMMLVGGGLRVALATTHLALRDVAAAITPEGLELTLRVLAHDLRSRFGLARPRILVCGLNPHAGEAGYLGREEIDTIEPALQRARAGGLDVVGPLPADTLFQAKYLDGADVVLAMYHDQGLTVLKYASFGRGVNVTLGLPIIRTSVDHGTALDLAGTGLADAGSMRVALETAAAMIGAGRSPLARAA
jgi:4-hydroxythreonine-4-phosphate dehydrogenase